MLFNSLYVLYMCVYAYEYTYAYTHKHTFLKWVVVKMISFYWLTLPQLFWVTLWPSVNTSWPSKCSLAQIPHAQLSWTNTEPFWPLSRLVNGRVLQRGFKDAVALGATFSMLMAILALSGEPVWDGGGLWLRELHCQHAGMAPLCFHSLPLFPC